MESDRPLRQKSLRYKVIGLALASLGLWPSSAAAICGDATSASGCPCDCNGDSTVTVDELLRTVNAALSGGDGGCVARGCLDTRQLDVAYIVDCISIALNGCPADLSDEGEECDDGGLCTGGANAGTPCTAESDCSGAGACFGGINDLHGCIGDHECAGAPCKRCRPYGGDGCAANCTIEADELCVLLPYMPDSIGVGFPSGSRLNAFPSDFIRMPIPISGSQVSTTGKLVGGSAPLVIKASQMDINPLRFSTIACGCMRGLDAVTCGGTLFERDGSPSLNCSSEFQGAASCPPDKECAPVHGPGNSGSGFVTCGGSNTDVEVLQDCNGTPGAEPFDPQVASSASGVSLPANRGSGLIAVTAAIGTVVGTCSGSAAEYGPDGLFCTADDPIASRGTARSFVFTTGSVSATTLNVFDTSDMLGPIETNGQPSSCSATRIGLSGLDLAAGYTTCSQLTVADGAGTVNLVCD